MSTLRWTRDKSDRKVRIAKYLGRTIRMTRGNNCFFARVGAHVVRGRFAYEAENAIKLYIKETHVEEHATMQITEMRPDVSAIFDRVSNHDYGSQGFVTLAWLCEVSPSNSDVRKVPVIIHRAAYNVGEEAPRPRYFRIDF